MAETQIWQLIIIFLIYRRPCSPNRHYSWSYIAWIERMRSSALYSTAIRSIENAPNTIEPV